MGAQPLRRGVEPGDVAELHGGQMAHPPVDLALVEPVGTAETLEAPRPPVHLGQLGDAVDELERQPPARFEVGVERCGPAPAAHRRPAVDVLHHIEAAPHELGVVAHRQRPGVGDVGVGQRGQQPVLAQHGLVAPVGDDARRTAQRHAVPAAADLEQLVRRAARDERGLDRLARPGQAVLVEELLQALEVDQPPRARLVVDNRSSTGSSSAAFPGDRAGGHWLATSCSRCSANFWRAAASFSGRCSVGHAPGAAL